MTQFQIQAIGSNQPLDPPVNAVPNIRQVEADAIEAMAGIPGIALSRLPGVEPSNDSSIQTARPRQLWTANQKIGAGSIGLAASVSVSSLTNRGSQRASSGVAKEDLIYRSKDADSRKEVLDALEVAREALEPYHIKAQKEKVLQELKQIKQGDVDFDCEADREAALAAVRCTLESLDKRLRKTNIQYTKALKTLKNYALAVEAICQSESDQVSIKSQSSVAVKNIEDLMDPVETAWKGIPGRTPDLPKSACSQTCPLVRLKQIRQHLESKIIAIDSKQAQRLEQVANHEVISVILDKFRDGQLPPDSSIFFFVRDGRPLLRIDTSAKLRPRPGQSMRDAIKHATKTPEFIDVNRLNQGWGPNGAGLFRFSNVCDIIVGAVVLTPEMKDGKPITLPGMRKPKRIVHCTIGKVPEAVVKDMPYGAILNKFRNQTEQIFAHCVRSLE